jgi:hypothetical protein
MLLKPDATLIAPKEYLFLKIHSAGKRGFF